MTVKGKTVLITGSTDGVGRYVAERLAAEGARVIIHGRDRARGEAVVQRITQEGGDARLLVADLSSLAEVRSLAEAVQRDLDGLDALINNAGIGTSGARRELSADGFELQVRGQLSCGISFDAPLAAGAGEPRLFPHRQCRLGRTAADRLRRCDADPRL